MTVGGNTQGRQFASDSQTPRRHAKADPILGRRVRFWLPAFQESATRPRKPMTISPRHREALFAVLFRVKKSKCSCRSLCPTRGCKISESGCFTGVSSISTGARPQSGWAQRIDVVLAAIYRRLFSNAPCLRCTPTTSCTAGCCCKQGPSPTTSESNLPLAGVLRVNSAGTLMYTPVHGISPIPFNVGPIILAGSVTSSSDLCWPCCL